MNQIDMLMQTHDYMIELAQEKDLLDKGVYPPAAKNSRFLAVARRLAMAIANDYYAANRKPLALSLQQRDALRVGSFIDTLEAVAESINQVVDIRVMRGVTVKMLEAWLEQEGYIERHYLQSSPQDWWYGPTEKGERIGIWQDDDQAVYRAPLRFHDCAQRVIFQYFDPTGLPQEEDSGRPYERNVVFRVGDVKSDINYLKHRIEQRDYFGQPLAEDDPRCQQAQKYCAFAATVLMRSLAAGYPTAKAPFTLPRELWDKIPLQRVLISISDFCSAVNSVIPDPCAVEKLEISAPRRYLASQGLLDVYTTEKGLTTYRVNARSASFGIAKGWPRDPDDDDDDAHYPTVLLDYSAQKYLAKHLGEIIALNAW